MSVIDYKDKDGTLRIRGKIGRPDLPDPGGIGGIYQMRPRKNGPIQVKMAYYQPTGAPGPGQLIQREKMRVCMANWQSFSADQKKEYGRRARTRQMTGMNLYLRDCLRFVVLPTNLLMSEDGTYLLQEDSSKIVL